MKRFLFVPLVLLSFAAYAADVLHRKTSDTVYIESGGTLNVKSGGTATMDSGSTTNLSGNVNTSGMVSSTSIYGNPLMQNTKQSITAAQLNSGYSFLASVNGKSIVPGAGFSIMASGTAATATNVSLKCSGGGIIATFPIAMLVTGLPVGAFTSGYAGTGATLASSLTQGCPATESIMASTGGAGITGTTHLFINMPYTVQ